LLHTTLSDSFTEWAESTEPKLRHALTASFGPQLGKEVAVDALSHAWEHWDRIRGMENPAGYVFGVARNKARRANDDRSIGFPVVSQRLPDVEPGLPNAVAMLSEQQRIERDPVVVPVVMRVFGGVGWPSLGRIRLGFAGRAMSVAD
jgi:DNA-directed RNA polymerase specialized sigma24 family protein